MHTRLAIANPEEGDARVAADVHDRGWRRRSGDPVDVPARSRRTLELSTVPELAGASFSTVLESDRAGRGRSARRARSGRPGDERRDRRRRAVADVVLRRGPDGGAVRAVLPRAEPRRHRRAGRGPLPAARGRRADRPHATRWPRTAARPSGSIARQPSLAADRGRGGDHEPRRRAHRRRAHALHDRGRLAAAAERASRTPASRRSTRRPTATRRRRERAGCWRTGSSAADAWRSPGDRDRQPRRGHGRDGDAAVRGRRRGHGRVPGRGRRAARRAAGAGVPGGRRPALLDARREPPIRPRDAGGRLAAVRDRAAAPTARDGSTPAEARARPGRLLFVSPSRRRRRALAGRGDRCPAACPSARLAGVPTAAAEPGARRRSPPLPPPRQSTSPPEAAASNATTTPSATASPSARRWAPSAGSS